MRDSRKLRRRAFLILWGGWTAAAVILALVLPKMLFQSGSTAIGVAVLALVGLAFWRWETRFRVKHLPQGTRRGWHAGLVVVPLLLASQLPRHANKACEIIPGGMRWTMEYSYWADPFFKDPLALTMTQVNDFLAGPEAEEGLLLSLTLNYTNITWGKPRPTLVGGSIQRTKVTEDPWKISLHPATASRGEQEINLRAAGWTELTRHLAPNLSSETQGGLGRALSEKFREKGSAQPVSGIFWGSNFQTVRTIPLPWVLVTAGLFSLLLLPVTWLVVRFTMSPKKTPADAVAR